MKLLCFFNEKFSGRKLEMYVKSSKVGRGYRLDLCQDAGSWKNETFSSWDFLIQKNGTILVVPGILGRVDPSHVLGFLFFSWWYGTGDEILALDSLDV